MEGAQKQAAECEDFKHTTTMPESKCAEDANKAAQRQAAQSADDEVWRKFFDHRKPQAETRSRAEDANEAAHRQAAQSADDEVWWHGLRRAVFRATKNHGAQAGLQEVEKPHAGDAAPAERVP